MTTELTEARINPPQSLLTQINQLSFGHTTRPPIGCVTPQASTARPKHAQFAGAGLEIIPVKRN
jgi:hypothetical protein